MTCAVTNGVIARLLPNKSSGVERVNVLMANVYQRHLVMPQDWVILGRCAGALWSSYEALQLALPLAQGEHMGSSSGRSFKALLWRYRDD